MYSSKTIEKMKNSIFILSIVFVLAACGQKPADKAATDEKSATETVTQVKKGKKYPIEKGIVYQKSDVMGIVSNPVIYFDKWGEWEATETTTSIEMMGIKESSTSLKIVKGEDNWEIDMDKKTGFHYNRAVMINQMGVDMENLTTEIMGKMKLEKVGEEKYLGYPCVKFKMKNDEMKMDVEYLMYGNLMMKMTGKAMEIPTSIEVTKIEAVTPPAEKFEIPAGITITEQ